LGEKQKTIFLIDDSTTNLTIGKDLLSDTYNVYTFISGEMMFIALNRVVPDLILLDVEMPDMSGYDIIKRLKDDKETAAIPVIFLTAHDNAESELKGFNLGAIDYITKPFSAPRLLNRLEMHLNLLSANQALNYREKLLSATNRTAEVLLTANEENIMDAVMEGLKIVGRCLDLDRVQLWQSGVVDGKQQFSMKYQWLSEVGSKKCEIPLEMSISNPDWYDRFLRGESINGPISDLSQEDREFLGAYDIKTTVMIPLFLSKEFIGFFSADDCRNERTFTDDEMDMLVSTGLMLLNIFNRLEQIRLRTEVEVEREANQLKEVFLESSPFVMNIWDDSINLISTSRQVAKMFELESQEQYIERFFDLSPKYQPCGELSDTKAHKLLNQALQQDEQIKFEWEHQTLDGREIPMEVTLSRFKRHGRYYVVTYAVDLRSVKEALQRERELMERWTLINEATPIGVNFWDEKLNYLGGNEMGYKIFGFSSADEFNSKWQSIMPEFQPDGIFSLEKMSSAFERTIVEGRYRCEWLHETVDGQQLPLDISFVRIKNKSGYIIVCFLQDLRPIKAAMEIEREREVNERIKLLFDAAPIAIGMYDEDITFIDCNLEMQRLYEFHDKDKFIKTFNERRHDFAPLIQPCGTPSDKLMQNSFKQAALDGRFRTEGAILTSDGTNIPVEITIICINYRDSSMFVVFLRDLRELFERKRTEVAEESSRAKTRFLARMSHEIRTPITAVSGISEIQLQNPTLPPEVEESFAKIHDSSNMLLCIVNDILDLSKIEAGKMSLACEKYDTAGLVSDAAQPHTALPDSSAIEFRVHVDENIPKFLIGDALRIKQIMNNILSNAFKYTESGSVELSVNCQKNPTDTAKTILVISIRDTGFGMSREQLNDLFKEEYIRFHERETPYVTGTGLGMAIVSSLVQLMSAEINVESEMGKGTTVVVRIPQDIFGFEVIGKEVADSLGRFDVSASVAAKKFKFTPESMPYGRVLVVDDVDANLYVAKGLLSFYDLNIETCESGYDAIDKIKRGNMYDIVFMDEMMPGLSGLETMRTMRAAGYTRPIVALTANALIGQAEEFIKNGFDGFISKPIQTVHLNTVLIKHIRDKQPPEVIIAANSASRTGKGDIDEFQCNPDLLKKLRLDFAVNHKNKFTDICQAINSGDTKTAHRIAHTVKGSAGLIYEKNLANVAEDLEKQLADGNLVETALLSLFESELARVLADIGEPETLIAKEGELLSNAEAVALLDKVKPLLLTQDIASMQLLDDLRKIPQSAELCRHLQDYDFAGAIESLNNLKATL